MDSIGKSLALALIGVFVMSFFVGLDGAVIGAPADNNLWSSKKPMVTGRTDFGLAEVNGKIYAIGGYPDLNLTEEYDPKEDTWTTKAAMPTARFNFAIAVFENKIYCIGGSEGSRNFYQASLITGAIEVYDPATDTWEIKKPMPTPVTQLEANVVNEKIYLIGGRTGGQHTTVALNQVYDPVAESWIRKANMTYPVVNYASAVVNDKIYVIGGQDEFNNPMNLNVTQIYDTKQDSWSFGKPLAFALIDSSACTLPFSNTIYLIGGQNGSNGKSTNATQIYDTEKNIWSFGPSMLTARFKLSATVLNSSIYAIGGTSHYIFPNEQASAANEMYTVINETPNPTPTIPEFSLVTILILTASTFFIAIMIKHKRFNIKYNQH